MKRSAIALISGVLFGVGLVIAGMTRPTKILAFLDVTGAWDPSLAFVMMGAIVVHAVAVAVAQRRSASFAGEPFRWPTTKGVDRALIVGAAIFGVGWGLGGFCPGPALVSASAGNRSAIVFVVAMATDRLDGELARSRGLITDFGKLADPIADKALTGMAFIGLSLIGQLWWWVTVLVLVREIGITVLRFVVIRYGVMPASRGGKLKTVLQAVALSMLLAPIGGVWLWLSGAVMAAAVLVTVVTGVDYVLQARRLVSGRS